MFLILAEILVLVGGAIPPAPAMPDSTRISARLKRIQGHSSPVNICNAAAAPRNLRAGGMPRLLSVWTAHSWVDEGLSNHRTGAVATIVLVPWGFCVRVSGSGTWPGILYQGFPVLG